MIIWRTVGRPFAALCFIVASIAGAHAQQRCPTASTNLKALTNDLTRGQLLEEHTRQMILSSPRAKKMSAQSVEQLAAKQPSFNFPHDALYKQNNVPRQNSIFGIDISHHQGAKFPFSGLAKQSVSYVYVKATQGTGYKDAIFPSTGRLPGACPRGKRFHAALIISCHPTHR